MTRVFATGKISAGRTERSAVSPEAIGLFGEPQPKPGPDTAAYRRQNSGSGQPAK